MHIRTNNHPHDLTYKYNFFLLETIKLVLRAIPSDNDVDNHDSNRVTLVIQQRPRLSKILFQIRMDTDKFILIVERGFKSFLSNKNASPEDREYAKMLLIIQVDCKKL
jgi:hypothetical protein